MAISEDLRSVQATLDTMIGAPLDGGSMLRLVCSNLLALADQVEALENTPLATHELTDFHDKRFRRIKQAVVRAC